MKRKAFTLLELIIAITIFTIFIGFVMSAYMTFHRSQQNIAMTRSLLYEADHILNLFEEKMTLLQIDYSYYEDRTEYETQELAFASLDGAEKFLFYWEEDLENEEIGALYLIQNDSEPIQINSKNVSVDFLSFRIFPLDNPYLIDNQRDVNFPHFQPNVQFKITLSSAGIKEEREQVNIQTSLTSRFYQ